MAKHRYSGPQSAASPWQTRFALALRQSLQEGYRASDFRADLGAGLVVGIVALPLSLALAIASGVPPQHGLYTAIIAGALIAVLGGSRVQISGPTAAFVAVLAPIAAKYGLGGLLMATMMAGVILLMMGFAGLGGLIQFIPYPVTSGFTAGIALVIGTLQIKDFLGLTVEHLPAHYLERLWALLAALPTTRWPDLAVGSLTLVLLFAWPKLTKKVPSPLAALAIASVAAWGIMRATGLPIDTIETRFSYLVDGVAHAGIPRVPPLPAFPWSFPGPNGQPLALDLEMIRTLASSAFAIAMLGAIESLLSAVIADGMTGQQHDPDSELMAQGFGNIVAPFFGGIAATGAIARTATNVRSGGRTPIAGVVHSVFVLAAVLLLAPLIGHLPMAALAALLLVIAWNMSEIRHVIHTLRVAPRSDVLVLLTCFGLTVLFDMTVSVTVGVMLASLLFMRRMAEVSSVNLLTAGHPSLPRDLPKDVLVYEVTGALFFGAAQKAMSALKTVQRGVKVVVLDMRSVPAMDATGLVNLESALERLNGAGILVVIGGLQRQPARLLAKAGWRNRPGKLAVFLSFDKACEQAASLADETKH
ncbi:MAG: C4-dicarboxylic acid transporter DauA [Candidatus Eisenbacteria bacterium]|nr:C4-dicarboxylic acid transporter DauA [Candidatus Eisenbacteria bacterium]MCC7141648.1 C4-dicarboxylic acid transporter DauA [Candidatus Eisenbacteria bacterium]